MLNFDEVLKGKVPSATMSAAPDRELELILKRDPTDQQAQVDVGSDGSMDASDPPSACQPGGNEPVPSNDFPETPKVVGETLNPLPGPPGGGKF
jgi:hypothetical protein